MFGNIINYNNDIIIIKNNSHVANTNYIGYHVIFEEKDRKIVAEITSIDAETITLMLIGEIINSKFSNGVLILPNVNIIPRIIYKSELELLLGNQNYLDKNNLLFGTSPIYKNYYITASPNDFLSNHFAVIGNTGAGKSCSVARLIQNIFYRSSSELPNNAHIVLFDLYGEYENTFNEMDNFESLHYKKLTTKLDFASDATLNIPTHFLTVDDLALLLEANDPNQLPVLSKAIDLVKIFASNDPNANEYKNDIIARCVLEILSAGENPSQIRDQIISVLTTYNTESLNLNTKINQPGYIRTIRQCLNIDEQGKINAMNILVEFLTDFVKVDINTDHKPKNVMYTLSDLYNALEFALINEGLYTSEASYDRNNLLKSRLQTIINSNKNEYFKCDKYISKKDYIENFFKTLDKNEKAQLIDINLSYIDDKFAKCITKILSKLFFEYNISLEHKGSFPIHIILEEAHRLVSNDTDQKIIGYNIFDRITKEGRKYGTILGFITQRPNELSKTALSQCSNFIVFRLFYPEDLNIVKNISSNVREDILDKIKTLHPGMGLVFGTAFKIPLLVNFPLPNPMPVSNNLNISNLWYEDNTQDN